MAWDEVAGAWVCTAAWWALGEVPCRLVLLVVEVAACKLVLWALEDCKLA